MRTADEIFTDWYNRRKGIVCALTTDSDKLFEACDPNKENLCLYGLPDGNWAVDTPADEVRACLGARDRLVSMLGPACRQYFAYRYLQRVPNQYLVRPVAALSGCRCNPVDFFVVPAPRVCCIPL